MENGKRYLIIKKQENSCFPIKLAYWFDERVTNRHTYKAGFYHSEAFYYPHENVLQYMDMEKIPSFNEWVLDEPVEGERIVFSIAGIFTVAIFFFVGLTPFNLTLEISLYN